MKRYRTLRGLRRSRRYADRRLLLAAIGVVAVLWALHGPVLGAKLLPAQVVRVTDGDTIQVDVSGEGRRWVRIATIDAPEKGRRGAAGQPYAERSRQNLARLVEHQPVRLMTLGQDDYGRILARVRVRDAQLAKEIDVGLAQICAGYAWLYEAYADSLTVAEQHEYRSCQNVARVEKRGLWRAPEPIPPWTWRHSRRGSVPR